MCLRKIYSGRNRKKTPEQTHNDSRRITEQLQIQNSHISGHPIEARA